MFIAFGATQGLLRRVRASQQLQFWVILNELSSSSVYRRFSDICIIIYLFASAFAYLAPF